MSLRPSLSSFDLSRLTSLFGCGDLEVENAVLRRFRKQYADNLALRVRATELVRAIIHRGRDGHYPHGEDEAFQIVVNALVQHQEPVRSTSIFWEQFMSEADHPLLLPLINGRPLFGARNASSWAFYGYLLADEIVKLRDFIRGDEKWSRAFDAEEALEWLDATCAAGRDVWGWAT